MINLSYKDLLILNTELSRSPDERTVPIRQAVQKELDSVPEAMIPVCLSGESMDSASKNIYFLSQEGIDRHLQQLSRRNMKKGYSVLIHCPHKAVGHYVFDRIARFHSPVKMSYSNQSLELQNGVLVHVYSGKQTSTAVKGHLFDVGIVLSYESMPSA